MSKVKMMIFLLCLLMFRGSAWAKSLKPFWQPAKPFRVAQSYVAQGQTTPQEPDDDDDDEDDDSDDDDDDED